MTYCDSTHIDDATLAHAIIGLAKIETSSLWLEFQEDLQFEWNDQPAEDLEHCTLGKKMFFHEIASRAARLFAVDRRRVERIAEAVSCRTRHRVLLDLIAEYVQRIDGTMPAANTSTGTPAAIARARRS